LKNQKFKKFETILVDNGSTDGSVEYVKKKFPEVKILPLDKNYGFSKGNNIGIEKANGKYIVFLNNDTRADPNWLYELVMAAEESPDSTGSFASKLLYYDNPEIIDSAGDGYTIMGNAFKRGELEPDSDKFNKKEIIFYACAAAAMYKKKVLDEIGWFDDVNFSPAIHEDTDLGYRALIAGYRCIFVPRAKVFHKVSSTTGRLNDFVVYQSQRNSEFVYLKNTPWQMILKYGIFHLFLNIKDLLSLSVRGYGKSIFRAKWEVLKNFRSLLKLRKKIQSRRKISISELDSYLS
jgi:hypothetical protein